MKGVAVHEEESDDKTELADRSLMYRSLWIITGNDIKNANKFIIVNIILYYS